ncbi:MAG TPA: MFS transporter [Candidatus Limnocylindria bacterium]|nr:MFS transporter [Candidatus Limnocylindria bacterium]
MNRSIRAVLVGNFTLRFSTGLTGTLLLLYLADLPDYGGVVVSATTAGLMGALYFVAELILSPFFGVLADRFGTHRLMQPGPIMGAVAVIVTALTAIAGTAITANVPVLAGTRFLEGAAAAASVPAALGYIAIATSRDQALRGRVIGRFEVATLGGVGIGSVVAGFLYSALGPTAFYVNAAIYGITFLVLRYGVDDLPEHIPPAPGEETVPASLFHLGRYRDVLRSRPIWFLAPTWIALNALLGSWGTQAIFQLVQEPSPEFSDQLLMQGIEPWQAGLVLGVGLLVLFSGLLYWGTRFTRLRRTTIIGLGLGGGLLFVGALLALNHSTGQAAWFIVATLVAAGIGVFVLAGATPAAVGFLSDISETYPGRRGVIMGLYSVFLALGQIIGAVVAGVAAEWRGIDGLLVASAGLLIVALIPLGQLRAQEHHMPGSELAPAA